MYSATKDDVKKLALQIESLAKEVAATIDNGGDVLSVANKLVRDSTTFVFTLGEAHAVEQLAQSTVKAVKVKLVSSGKNTNYHNVRDSLGRFKKA